MPAGRLLDVLESGFQCARTPWIRGFMALQLTRRGRTVRLMVPVCPESGFWGVPAGPRAHGPQPGCTSYSGDLSGWSGRQARQGVQPASRAAARVILSRSLSPMKRMRMQLALWYLGTPGTTVTSMLGSGPAGPAWAACLSCLGCSGCLVAGALAAGVLPGTSVISGSAAGSASETGSGPPDGLSSGAGTGSGWLAAEGWLVAEGWLAAAGLAAS
jgi:hypothetical protein